MMSTTQQSKTMMERHVRVRLGPRAGFELGPLIPGRQRKRGKMMPGRPNEKRPAWSDS
jgi:hypothetical protein